MAVRIAKNDPTDILCRAYGFAASTDEVIGGRFAQDFAGPAFWTRKLDFTVKGMPEFRGLRYIDFKDCTNTYALFKDGESCSIYSLPEDKVKKIAAGLKEGLRKRKVNQIKI